MNAWKDGLSIYDGRIQEKKQVKVSLVYVKSEVPAGHLDEVY